MKSRMLLLFHQWLVFQENSLRRIEESIALCVQYCEKEYSDINVHRLEKYIDDVCRQLQKIQQHQKSIDSFIHTSHTGISKNTLQRCCTIREKISSVSQSTANLCSTLHKKLEALQSQIHYSTIFSTQLFFFNKTSASR